MSFKYPKEVRDYFAQKQREYRAKQKYVLQVCIKPTDQQTCKLAVLKQTKFDTEMILCCEASVWVKCKYRKGF